MPRGDRSSHPHRGVSGSFRGAVGYSGVSADDAADPAVVFPPRSVTVPASSTSPLTAGSDTIQVLSVLGPFRVAHDTPDVTTDVGVVIANLDPGTIVVNYWATAIELFFDTVSGDFISLNIADVSDPASTWLGVKFYDLTLAQALAGPVIAKEIMRDDTSKLPALVVTDSQLSVSITTNGTNGEIDVYVLTATAA